MKTCLIVEDSAVIRTIIAEILKDLDLAPVECAVATEAVDYCAAERPGVVLLDWDLPNFGALDFLRGVGAMAAEDRPEIVICATENDHQQFALAKAAGAGHHLLKPFDKAALAGKLVEIGLIEETVLETLREENERDDSASQSQQATGTQ